MSEPTTYLTDAQLDKLPKYARYEITRLVGLVEHHEKTLQAMAGEADTPITVRLGHRQNIGLPTDAYIRWHLDNDRDVEAAYKGGHLILRSTHGQLEIRPHVSNVIELRVLE
jgi:hypothetical protein